MIFPKLETIKEIVANIAEQQLLPRFVDAESTIKQDGSIVTQADVAMQQALIQELGKRWPHIPILGEEMTAAEQQALLTEDGEALWCIDPLDGTSNFASGLPVFSVSVALLYRGQPQLGVVYDPIREECFAAEHGRGAWLNGHRLEKKKNVPTLRRSIAVVDFKRLTPALARRLVEQPPYHSQRSLGSVALDWCWLAAGRFHVFLHGKQRLWDYAAGSLILDEVGGCSQTLEGEPVFQPSIAPRSALAAQDERLFLEWADWLRG